MPTAAVARHQQNVAAQVVLAGATPDVEVRIDWRTTLGPLTVPEIDDGGFERSVGNWSVAASALNDAATSITHITSDFQAGAAAAEIQPTASTASGAHYAFGSGVTFETGFTYQATVYFKVASGTTGVAILLGTAANFATAAYTATTTWTARTVDWAPPTDTTNVLLSVTHNTAALDAFRVDSASIATIEDSGLDTAPFNAITNDGFETNTTGWSVSAGINAAATSITRVTTDSFAGLASATLVTTSTSGSGTNWDFGTRAFIVGRTYRFRVGLRSVSGTTGAKLILGSLTPGDRATEVITLTTSWAHYAVDWTATSSHLDVEAVITNGSAAAMTVAIDDAGVFETLEDASGDVMNLSYGRSVELDGSGTPPGTLTMTLRNDDQRYDPENTASPLYGLIKMGRAVWVRAAYAEVVSALAYGVIRRVIPRPREKTVQILCEDPLYHFGRVETSVAVSTTKTIHDFREDILDDIGEAASRRSLSTDTAELTAPYTGADQVLAKGRLDDLDRATGTVAWMRPHTSSAVLYQYVTKGRMDLISGVALETFHGSDTGLVDVSDYDLTDEALVNSQRVMPRFRTLQADAIVWEYNAVPFTVYAGVTTTIWASYSEPTSSQLLFATVSPALASGTIVPFSKSGKIEMTAGANNVTVTALWVTGTALVADDPASVRAIDQDSIDEHGEYKGSDIDSDYISNLPFAEALASYLVARGADGPVRPGVQIINRFPSQLEREIGDRVELVVDSLSAATECLIGGLSTTITPGALWQTTYQLEESATSNWLIWDDDASLWDTARWGF